MQVLLNFFNLFFRILMGYNKQGLMFVSGGHLQYPNTDVLGIANLIGTVPYALMH